MRPLPPILSYGSSSLPYNAQIGGPYPAFQSALQALRLSLPSGAMALARAASAATYAPPYSINVINKDEPRSGDSIQLQLVCAAGAGVPDQLVWNFGDGRIVTVNRVSLSHRPMPHRCLSGVRAAV